MEQTLADLQRWYADQCDGDWEHGRGVSISSLDNPGWIVKIELAGTDLEGREFEPVAVGLGEQDAADWHSISVKNNTFVAAGDPSKLASMLQTFLAWAQRPGT